MNIELLNKLADVLRREDFDFTWDYDKPSTCGIACIDKIIGKGRLRPDDRAEILGITEEQHARIFYYAARAEDYPDKVLPEHVAKVIEGVIAEGYGDV